MLNTHKSQTGPSAAAAIADLEKRLEQIFAAQTNEVEQSLLEKINREKEEAQKKIESVRREFEKVRGILEEHRSVMTELESAREGLRTRIREHFSRAMDHQKLMEKAAALAIDELQRIDELNRQLDDIRRRAVEETSALRDLLQSHGGIVPELPVFPEAPEVPVDWSKELLKMQKVQALLFSSNGSEAHVAAHEAAPAEAPAPKPEPKVELEPEPEPFAAAPASAAQASEDDFDGVEFPETDPGWDDIPDAAAHAARPEAPPPASAGSRGAWLDGGAQASKESIEDVVPDQARRADSLARVLADYRKTEPINNGIELGFFETGSISMLDGESFVSAIDKICAGARDLHDQLNRTESVKDLFLLKQEILNQQEVLRKVYFRVVRFCDKESGTLPEFLADLINVPAMKDSLERLTMANWSDPSDFQPFVREITALKKAFEAKTSPPGDYIQSVLEQIGLN